MKNYQIIFSDLDRTLLPQNGDVSGKDRDTLNRLKNSDIPRVIATGRSLFSAKKVLSDDFPIDYLIFSTGAGIMDWSTKTILHHQSILPGDAKIIAEFLFSQKLNFMMHFEIPDNHNFLYSETGSAPPDFFRRRKFYKDYSEPFPAEYAFNDHITQFVVVMRNNPEMLKKIEQQFHSFTVIRTTSPLDHETVWVEIFPKTVSKSQGAAWLCHQMGFSAEQCLAIGNDYNDYDLLKWAGKGYVVGDAPEELKRQFNVAENHDNHAFSKVIDKEIFNR